MQVAELETELELERERTVDALDEVAALRSRLRNLKEGAHLQAAAAAAAAAAVAAAAVAEAEAEARFDTGRLPSRIERVSDSEGSREGSQSAASRVSPSLSASTPSPPQAANPAGPPEAHVGAAARRRLPLQDAANFSAAAAFARQDGYIADTTTQERTRVGGAPRQQVQVCGTCLPATAPPSHEPALALPAPTPLGCLCGAAAHRPDTRQGATAQHQRQHQHQAPGLGPGPGPGSQHQHPARWRGVVCAADLWTPRPAAGGDIAACWPSRHCCRGPSSTIRVPLFAACTLKSGLPAPTHFLEIKKLQLETYPEIRKGPK